MTGSLRAQVRARREDFVERWGRVLLALLVAFGLTACGAASGPYSPSKRAAAAEAPAAMATRAESGGEADMALEEPAPAPMVAQAVPRDRATTAGAKPPAPPAEATDAPKDVGAVDGESVDGKKKARSGAGAEGAGDGKTGKKAPLLIYKAEVHLAVFEVAERIDRAEAMARKAGGYLVRRDDRSVTVRIPARRFQGILEKMLGLGDVLHRNVSVRDVTAEYRDLEIQLKNLEALRARLAQLLEKAKDVKEALAVEKELGRVAGQIDRIKGRLKLLGELVAFSTITLRFEPRRSEHLKNDVKLPFPWLQRLGLGSLLRL